MQVYISTVDRIITPMNADVDVFYVMDAMDHANKSHQTVVRQMHIFHLYAFLCFTCFCLFLLFAAFLLILTACLLGVFHGFPFFSPQNTSQCVWVEVLCVARHSDMWCQQPDCMVHDIVLEPYGHFFLISNLVIYVAAHQENMLAHTMELGGTATLYPGFQVL